jgi:hypothetical protein
MGSSLRYYLYRAMFCAVILFTIYALSMRRSLLLIALVWAAPLILQHSVNFIDPKDPIVITNSVFAFAFDVFIVVVLFHRVFSKAQADSEAIFGALCIYLFVGFGFTRVFLLVTDFHPQAFYLDPTVNSHTVLTRLDAIYYSFGTMTSLGASGITPVSSEARLLTIIEALLGVLFLAVLISRLMSAYVGKPSPEKLEE